MSEDPSHRHKRVLGTVAFAFVATTLVAGGPFGLESSVKNAGPLPVFLAFLLLPLLFALPQAVITAELSTLFRDNGGVVLWTRAAFGDLAAWVVGFTTVIGNLVDLGLYPLLVTDYLAAAFRNGPADGGGDTEAAVVGVRTTALKIGGSSSVIIVDPALSHLGSSSSSPLGGLSSAGQFLVFLAVVVLGLGINLRGIRDVGMLSAVAFLVMMLPFVLSLLVQLPRVVTNLGATLQVAPSIEWAAFLSTMLWGYSGWASLGSLAGEIKSPSRTFTRGIALTMALVTACYALPTLVSITTHPKYEAWGPGSLASFTGDVGSWLKQLCIFSSVACQISVFTAGLSTNARMLWALAAGKPPPAPTSSASSSSASAGQGPGQGDVRKTLSFGGNNSSNNNNILPSIFAYESPSNGAPVVALAASCSVIALLSALPFQALVQADILLACVPLLAMVAAFVRLRKVYPVEKRLKIMGGKAGEDDDDERPFVVPWGWKGVLAAVVPKTAVIGIALGTAQLVTWLVLLSVVLTALKIYAGQRFLYHTRAGEAFRERVHLLMRRVLPKAWLDGQYAHDRSDRSDEEDEASLWKRSPAPVNRRGASNKGGKSHEEQESSSSSRRYVFGEFVSPPRPASKAIGQAAYSSTVSSSSASSGASGASRSGGTGTTGVRGSAGLDLLVLRQLDEVEERDRRHQHHHPHHPQQTPAAYESDYFSGLNMGAADGADEMLVV